MPIYIVVTPLLHGEGEEPTPPGASVNLDIDHDDVLVRSGALLPAADDEPLSAPTPPPPNDAPPSTNDKPLSAMKRAELVIEAEKAGVSIAVGMTNKQVVTAIEAKRTEAGA